MENKINEEVLCVLKREKSGEKIEINFATIVNPLIIELDKLYRLCDSIESEPDEILNYIEKNTKVKEMLSRYNFCQSLAGAYQGIPDYNKELINYFILEDNEQTLEEKQEFIAKRKISLKDIFKNRELPFSIKLAYEKCASDKSVLAYSHRETGWAMPKYSLNRNFSIEFKTNFGYGWASYFYTKIRYKQIDIIPFSD